MRLFSNALLPLLTCCSAVFAADRGWLFDHGELVIAGKGADFKGFRGNLAPTGFLTSKAITLRGADTLKITLTAVEGKTKIPKRPHQAFLTFREKSSGLEESFAFSVKENGQAKIDVMQKDLPIQFVTSPEPIEVHIVLGSFDSSTPFKKHQFNLNIDTDSASPPAAPSPPERYTKKPVINHIFRADPQSTYKILSLVFTLAVLAAVPALFGGWLYLGGNIEHAEKAFGANPVAHGLFLGSIVAMEGVFFMYYVSWNLFQTLPVAAVVGAVAFVSGSRALTEVQERRLAGQR